MKKALMLAAGMMLAALSAYAGEVSVYPGARLEKAEMKSAEAVLAKLPPQVRKSIGTSRIYTTADSFAQVYGYYQKRYAETDLDMKKIKVKIATGQIVSDAYFCLDGAKTVRDSKHFLKIQFPRAAVVKPGAPGVTVPKPPEVTLIQFTDKE